jgi:hypothetical protein
LAELHRQRRRGYRKKLKDFAEWTFKYSAKSKQIKDACEKLEQKEGVTDGTRRQLEKQVMALRKEIPEEPDLSPESMPAWISWLDLNHFRTHIPLGMGGAQPGAISMEAILGYMRLRGVPRAYRLELFRFIAKIDEAYLDQIRREYAAEAGKRNKQ